MKSKERGKKVRLAWSRAQKHIGGCLSRQAAVQVSDQKAWSSLDPFIGNTVQLIAHASYDESRDSTSQGDAWCDCLMVRLRPGQASLWTVVSSVVEHRNLVWKANGLTKMKAEVSDCSLLGSWVLPPWSPHLPRAIPTRDPPSYPSGATQYGMKSMQENGGFQGVFTNYEVVLVVRREDGRFCQPVEQVWETLG